MSTTPAAALLCLVCFVLAPVHVRAQGQEVGDDSVTQTTLDIDTPELAQGVSGAKEPNQRFVYGYLFGGGGWFFDEGTITPLRGDDTAYDLYRHTSATWQLGTGVEWRFWRSLGAAAEGSVTVVADQPTGLLSLNGIYHFGSAQTSGSRVVPFVTGGYSLSTEHGPNVGGGVNYWFHERVALRVEARGWQLIRARQFDFDPRPWFVDLRFGLSF